MTLLDNLILLAAAGLVTGLLVPFISARMNDRRVTQQRQAEEDLADLHGWLFGDADPALTAIARRSLAGEPIGAGPWRERHTVTMAELFSRVDKVLTNIARDVGLIGRQHATR